MKSLDTETTGLDLRHGCKPFLVTMCNEQEEQICWEWEVNPHNRQPTISKQDVREIAHEIQLELDSEDPCMIFHHAKFDMRALELIGVLRHLDVDKLWDSIQDTMIIGHMLNSALPKNLTWMCKEYLGLNVKPYEDVLREACNQARRHARSHYKDWLIAKTGVKSLPSAKETVWKCDLWLPKTIAVKEDYPKDHDWHTLLETYANVDSASTLLLYKAVIEIIKDRKLTKILDVRRQLLPIAYNMESRGIGLSMDRLKELELRFKQESKTHGNKCLNIASEYNYDLELPKSGSNNSLHTFVFGPLEVPVLKRSKKTGQPSLDKFTLEQYESLLPPRSMQVSFIKNLKAKRKRDTGLGFIESYHKFKVEMKRGKLRYYKVFPSLNPAGTVTLRWSSQNPNAQQISKQEETNLRYAFGPAPGKVWFSSDAKNIELRLSAYAAGEEEMIALFEKPNDPPYYGSYHLLVFDTLHPDKFAKYGMDCKNVFASTWYQWTKNGNFAVQYGAIESSGTADKAYHVEGAQSIISDRFQKVAELNKDQIQIANDNGYIQTMIDKNVDPNLGYPLACRETKWGGVLETVPLNYFIQGTAMWWMGKAMIRCAAYLKKVNSTRSVKNKIHMIIQVHDELVFEFPEGQNDESILIMQEIQRLMALGGDDIGIPTPVSLEYHPKCWSETQEL